MPMVLSPGVLNDAMRAVLLTAAVPCPPPLPDVKLDDLQIFPPSCVTSEYRSFAHKHYEWSRDRKEDFRRTPWIGDWMAWETEAAYCYRAWECLDEMKSIEHDERYKLTRLEELRNLLGIQNYYAGRMPPPVPVWRFHNRD